MTARLDIVDVTKAFGPAKALDRVSLGVEAGEFVVLLGPSGCGKTTLLSILGGFIAPSEGIVRIGGVDMTHVPPARRPTTTMFQDYALFPHMSLIDNVGFGLRMAGKGKAERHAKALAMLDMVGLKDAFARKPHELSGGQRQRVALARALAVDPDVLLLDEPLGALDLKLRRQMQDELKAIQRRIGTTFIHVTHDQEEAMAIADRIVVMKGGRIEDVGPPARIYMRPASHFSAGFMGEVNRIAGTLSGRGPDGGTVTVDTPLGRISLMETAFADGPPPAAGRDVTILVRPEQMLVDDDRPGVVGLGEARLVDGAFFGTHVRAHLAAGPDGALSLVAHLGQGADHRPGRICRIGIDREAIVALTGRGEA